MKPKDAFGGLFFSEIFGSGLYQWGGQFVRDPFGRSGDSPLLIHAVTGEGYYTRRVDADGETRRYYQKLILTPPRCLDILWPSDMFRIPDTGAERFGPPLAQNGFGQALAKRVGETAVLLFPCAGAAGASGRQYPAGPYSWKDPVLRRIAGRTIEIFDRLNTAGYVYQDFRLSRFFFGADGRVLLDFSNLIFPLEREGGGYASKGTRAPSAKEIPLEFADPAFVQGRKKRLDIRSQNYSLCALLFFLFLGRLPYEGRLLTGSSDKTAQEYLIKFREYHKMSIFIFDPDDSSNHIGVFQEEKLIVELWEQLPQPLKEAFLMALGQERIKNPHGICCPTPRTWLRTLGQLGWYP